MKRVCFVALWLLVAGMAFETGCSRPDPAAKAIQIVQRKVLRVNGTDYLIKDLVLVWNAAQNRVLDGSGAQATVMLTEEAAWSGEKTSGDKYRVTARHKDWVYEFEVNAASQEITATNALAKRLLNLSNTNPAKQSANIKPGETRK